MKRISLPILIRIFLSLTPVTLCQDQRFKLLQGRPSFSISARSGECGGRFGMFCGEDCETILTCAGPFEYSMSCPDINPSMPYCVNNSCSAEPSILCPVIICTGVGLFPDPTDCKRYYYCSKPGAIAIENQCPTGLVYGSKSEFCTLRRTWSDCKTIDCSRNQNKYVSYPGDSSILAFCQGTKRMPILFRCPDSSMEYDLKTLSCEFKCTSEGRFADKLDSTKFYGCYRNGGTFSSYHGSCPVGYSYHAEKQTCERKPSKPDITETTPTTTATNFNTTV